MQQQKVNRRHKIRVQSHPRRNTCTRGRESLSMKFTEEADFIWLSIGVGPGNLNAFMPMTKKPNRPLTNRGRQSTGPAFTSLKILRRHSLKALPASIRQRSSAPLYFGFAICSFPGSLVASPSFRPRAPKLQRRVAGKQCIARWARSKPVTPPASVSKRAKSLATRLHASKCRSPTRARTTCAPFPTLW